MKYTKTRRDEHEFSIGLGNRLTFRDIRKIVKEAKSKGVSDDALMYQGGIGSLKFKEF